MREVAKKNRTGKTLTWRKESREELAKEGRLQLGGISSLTETKMHIFIIPQVINSHFSFIRKSRIVNWFVLES